MATIPASQKLRPLETSVEKFGETRFIGLEIETTINRKSTPTEVYEDDNMNKREDFRRLVDPDDKILANAGYDGGEIEVATEPLARSLIYNNDVWVDKLLKNIEMYGIADSRSGTHVHISKLKKENKNLWRNLYWFSLVFDKQFYAIFRRKSNWALSPKEYFKERTSIYGPKLSIKDVCQHRYPNFGNKGTLIVKRDKTYECRAGSSSTNPLEIRAWAILFYNIVEFCNQTSILGHRFEEVLPINSELRNVIESRLTGEQLRQIVPDYIYIN